MAEDYLITGKLVSTKGPFLTRSGDLKADFHACEYLAVIANLNGPTTFIREKSNHILTITGDGQTGSWPLTPNSPVRSERIMPFSKRASLMLKTPEINCQVLFHWMSRTNNRPSHTLTRQIFRHGQPDNIYPDMTTSKDNISTGYIPIPSPPVIIR
jgi:hypothetical protein